MFEFNFELDARSVSCPLPIILSKISIKRLKGSQVLKVISCDPESVESIEAYCSQTGHELLSSDSLGKEFIFYIKKALR